MKFKIKDLFLLLVFIFNTKAWCENLDTVVETPVKNDINKIQLKQRDRPVNANECKDCHLFRAKRFFKKEYNPERAHEQIKNIHGRREMSCNSCHDINNRNLLLSSKYYPADFAVSSPVCAQCHNDKFRDWKKGLHGKRIGGWLAPKQQLQCVNCHDPHSVKFPSTEALPPPYKSPAIIPRHSLLKEEEKKIEYKEAESSVER